ncbi:MAG: hypothetical protein PHC92_02785 [Syntrophomonadaceae bacterium]|nr:hypothetical protein [Syntrophomonadaceae bacterium]MDD3022886.1 hypothetical protein [Syntrophomonadaceae bacterium]
MSNFLPVGVINDNISEICNKVNELRKYLDQQNLEALQQGFNELEDMALDLGLFIEKYSCQPLLYTGQGNTDEVIKRLDWALTFTEGVDPIQYFKSKIRSRKNRLK